MSHSDDAPHTPEPHVGVDEIAAALGYTRWTIYKLAAQRRIPCFRLRRSVRFRLSEVEAALRCGIADTDAPAALRDAPAPRSRRRRVSPSSSGTEPQRANEQPQDDVAGRLRAIAATTSILGKREVTNG